MQAMTCLPCGEGPCPVSICRCLGCNAGCRNFPRKPPYCGWVLGRAKDAKQLQLCYYCFNEIENIKNEPVQQVALASGAASSGCRCPACPGCFDHWKPNQVVCGQSYGKTRAAKANEFCHWCWDMRTSDPPDQDQQEAPAVDSALGPSSSTSVPAGRWETRPAYMASGGSGGMSSSSSAFHQEPLAYKAPPAPRPAHLNEPVQSLLADLAEAPSDVVLSMIPKDPPDSIHGDPRAAQEKKTQENSP